MNDYLIECQELLKAGHYRRLLEELKGWGEEAPGQLWAVVAWLVAQEDPEAGYLDYGQRVVCPNHEGSFDCTPFCPKCEGNQEFWESEPGFYFCHYETELVTLETVVNADNKETAYRMGLQQLKNELGVEITPIYWQCRLEAN
jgi:hypothetical protein